MQIICHDVLGIDNSSLLPQKSQSSTMLLKPLSLIFSIHILKHKAKFF